MSFDQRSSLPQIQSRRRIEDQLLRYPFHSYHIILETVQEQSHVLSQHPEREHGPLLVHRRYHEAGDLLRRAVDVDISVVQCYVVQHVT